MMFFRREVLPLDKPIKKKGKDILPKLEKQLAEVASQVEELDTKITELPDQIKEGSHTLDYKRQLIRTQADQVVQKEWLIQLVDIIEPNKYYLLSIGEAKVLGFLQKK